MNTDEEYRRAVLEPARAAGDQPPEDLRVRYMLREPLEPAAVAAAVKQVRQCWRRARGQLKYRRLVDRLEAEHRELAAVFAAAERGDVRPLAERLRGGRERDERRREAVRARLADAAGALRMVTPAEVEAIARAAGVPADEGRALAAVERIDVREPDRLPPTAPYAAYPKVRESLDVLGRRHLPDFLFGERLTGPMRVLDGFAAAGVTLDAAAVEAAVAAWARRSRDTSTTHAGTILAGLRSDADPSELVRYDIVERLRERARQRASERALLRFAMEDLGIEPGDARRLVFAIVRESGGGGGVAARLRALLDAGEVYAAAEMADGGLDNDAPDEAAVLAAEARRRVEAAVRLREQAAAETDPDRAWRLLADALRLVGDLPGAAELQRRLPPEPVPAVRADVDVTAGGTTVRLFFEPSPSTAGDVRYHVVRRRDRPPRGAADGEPLVGGRDERPPVNAPLYYAVTAVRGEAASAPVVTGPVVVRPEPADVAVAAGDGVVTGRWRLPAEAAGVRVTRDGHRVPATRDGFSEIVPNEATHHYLIAAVYLDADGREVVTPGVRRSAAPSAPPDPVFELAAAPDPADPDALFVRFDPPGHGTVELVLTHEPPPWPRSALLPVAELRGVVRRLPSDPAPGGLRVRPGSAGWIMAVTVAGGFAAIGAHHRHVHLPPPGRVVADRRGGHVHLGFDWPGDAAEVEVAFRVGRSGDGRPVTRRAVTRAAYDTQGGLRLPVPEDEPVEVTVAAVGTAGDGRLTGPAVSARVAARTVVAYELVRGGPPWRRSLTVRLSAGRAARIGRLELVLREGRVMPHRAGDGETVQVWESVPVPGEVTVDLPRVAGPYWLRCFADDDVIELGDPPVRSLRVAK
ncbi:hypothetical protein [Actinomadura rayongensis]|uniref:SaeA fourth Fn3-like domain-containing protein n=1 Tax=Actinomadura rayongensis TaxID=1429076 RepID=A0A6I4WE88_9ACTN|nr:hypothetical protein [Actinomadura rayongensis]MXQ67373.1 hypothetical protein [Actinomadura rayongensis]